MKTYKNLLLLFLFIIAPACLQAQSGGSPLSEERAPLDSLRAERSEALFNLDYGRAREVSDRICREFAQHPACPHAMASLLWVEKMNESRRLQTSLYSSKSFYAKTEDKVDPKLVEEFRSYIRQAKILAKARLKSNSQDVEALYYLGAAEGLNAVFSATIQRSFMSALSDGSSSVDHHRDVLKLDPNYREAEVTIGLYDYAVGSLPAPIKLLATIGGVRGSKKRGIATLERVARESVRAGDDARVLLITIFKREKRYADALKYTRELAAKYPGNYLFRVEVASALVLRAAFNRKAGMEAEAECDEREAFALYESLLLNKRNAYNLRQYDLIHFLYGEALLAAGQARRASAEFQAAMREARGEPGIASLASLRNAQALDLAGKRKEAMEEYRRVLQRPDTYATHEEAKKGLREPFGAVAVRER